MDDALDPIIASWNTGRFAEAADRLEEVWAGEVGARRECLRGMIHVAMGLYYAGVGDGDAARSKLTMAQRLLAPFAGNVLGVDVVDLRTAVAAILTRVEQGGSQNGPSGFLGGVSVPRLDAGFATVRHEVQRVGARHESCGLPEV